MNWIRTKTAYLQGVQAFLRNKVYLRPIVNRQIGAIASKPHLSLSQELIQAMQRKECARPGWKSRALARKD